MKVVDFLPADKTGQILTTSNKSPTKTYTSAQNALENAIKLILSTQDADNATSTALKQKLLKTAKFKPTEQILETIPFSSERKYSGVVTSNATYLMGAPEFLGVSELPDFDADYRIIAVTKDKKLLGFALLEDEIRRDAKEIISYFYDNNVAVKIISGDNLTTVQNIAKTVGVKDLAGIDLSTQKSPNYDKLVKEYSIFTRVKPAQKKELIKAFKKQGSTVAMTGDGVNDILAMKEADVSLAIGEGSDAARRSAKMVLLDSDFAGVPSIIAEGRQSINNLERSTTLFLSKTVYASILAVLFTIIPIEYPYAPIEMSLLNFACIGLPGLILALEPNTARIKNQFITNIKKYSIPIGITVSIAMVTLSVVANLNHFTRPELLTASLFTTFAIDLAMIYQISRPLNLLRGSLLASIIVIVASAFLIPYTRNLLDLTIPTLNVTIIVISLISLSLLFSLLLRHFFGSLTHKSPHQTPSPGSRHHS